MKKEMRLGEWLLAETFRHFRGTVNRVLGHLCIEPFTRGLHCTQQRLYVKFFYSEGGSKPYELKLCIWGLAQPAVT